MHATHERGLERLTDSPLFAGVVASFVNKLVADMIAQNRQIAEKLPGMGSLFSLGMGAASKMKGVSDQLLGDVAGKGAQFALRRTNSAILDVLRTAPVHAAAMQLWDVHADAPVSSLREYVDRADFAELAAIGYRLIASGRNTEFSATVLDACVDAFFERYGEYTLADLLPELGLSTELLVAEVQRYVPGIVAVVRPTACSSDWCVRGSSRSTTPIGCTSCSVGPAARSDLFVLDVRAEYRRIGAISSISPRRQLLP